MSPEFPSPGRPNRSTATRRTILKGSLGSMATLALGAPAIAALAGCSSKKSGKVSNASEVKLPAYIPQTAVKADLAAGRNGAPPGYFSYPADPADTVKKPPLGGTTISAITNLFLPPPPGAGSNKAWQGIEKRLGGSVKFQMVGSDDYATKLSTVIAGGDLPDVMTFLGLGAQSGIQDAPGFLESKCQDLTDALGGDAVKDYPNLANIPTVFWEQCTVAGKLWFVPIPRNISAGAGFVHRELVTKAGLKSTAELDSTEKLKSFFKEVTDKGKNRYALGASKDSYYANQTFYQTFGVPNQWKKSGDTIISQYDTDEFVQAVEFMAELHAAGYYFPGSEGWTKAQLQDAYQSGRICTMYDGFPSLVNPYWQSMPKINKSFKPGMFMPPGLNGRTPTTYADNINFAYTMLKKADSGHLKKVLGLLNFLAAPFGSSEYLLINYGVKGADYTVDAQHNPVLTDRGTRETAVPWKYLAAGPQVLYDPGHKDFVEYAHPVMKTIVSEAVKDPTAGAYSPTYAEKYQSISQTLTDSVSDIIAGRKPTSTLKSAVQKWKSGGGDKIAHEFAEALSPKKSTATS